MTADEIMNRAIAVRMAQGLSVEVMLTAISGDRQSHVRHCATLAERDAYVERCKARGESVRILG